MSYHSRSFVPRQQSAFPYVQHAHRRCRQFADFPEDQTLEEKKYFNPTTLTEILMISPEAAESIVEDAEALMYEHVENNSPLAEEEIIRIIIGVLLVHRRFSRSRNVDQFKKTFVAGFIRKMNLNCPHIPEACLTTEQRDALNATLLPERNSPDLYQVLLGLPFRLISIYGV